MTRKHLFCPLALFFLFLGLGAHQCLAAGFYLSEVGTPGSLGTAGVANPVNNYTADSAWTNPAGMTGVQEDQILSGVTLLFPKIEFEASVAEAGGSNGGNAGDFAGIPSFFYVKKMSDRTRLGFSLVAPLGGATDFGNDFVGRYGAYKLDLSGVSLSPSFAYKVNDKLSLGAGISIIYTFLEEEIAINRPGFLADGYVKLEELDDWGYQPFFGITYEINDRNFIGLVYRAETDTDLEGDMKFENMPLLSPTVNSIEVSWKNPQWLEVGFRHTLDNGLLVVLNAGWQDWSAFSENRFSIDTTKLDTDPIITVDRNFDDTWHAGIAYAQILNNKSRVSFGFSYDSSPVSDANRTIDLPFDETFKYSTSYSVLGDGKFDYAFGASLIVFGDGKVDQTAQGVRFAGEFDSNHMLMIGATIRPKSK
jgi:long-chain fatty acid transport protein